MSLGRQIRYARLNQYEQRANIARKTGIDIDRIRAIEEESITPTQDECIQIADVLALPAFILTTEHKSTVRINPNIPFAKACSAIRNPSHDDIDACLESYAAYWCNTRINSGSYADFDEFFGFTHNEAYELRNEMKTIYSIIDDRIGKRAVSLPSVPDNFAYLMVNRHGTSYQDLMLIEDCIRLQTETCLNRHSRDPKELENKDELVKKMANILVDMQISMHAHGISRDDIETAVNHRVRECCQKYEITF